MSDLNDRIAKVKGWTWDEELYIRTKPGAIPHYDKWLQEDLIEKETTHWCNPDGEPAMHPDFVGTLKGVAGMMRKLGDEWNWKWDGINSKWCCYREFNPMYPTAIFRSPAKRPGDCIGSAWLSVFDTSD